MFAHVHLGRIAADFSIAHPDVELEIVADDGMVDLVEDGFDIVIRANPDRDERLVGRRIARTERLVVATPGLTRPRDGGTARIVARAGEAAAEIWRLWEGGQVWTLRPSPSLRLSSLLMVRDAVLRGAGIALLPGNMVTEDLAAGRLISWGAQDGVETEVWVLHASRRLVGDKVLAFLRFLADRCSDSP